MKRGAGGDEERRGVVEVMKRGKELAVEVVEVVERAAVEHLRWSLEDEELAWISQCEEHQELEGVGVGLRDRLAVTTPWPGPVLNTHHPVLIKHNLSVRST
ncbi:unnamed protein product [Gadus morhua 'NCC']